MKLVKALAAVGWNPELLLTQGKEKFLVKKEAVKLHHSGWLTLKKSTYFSKTHLRKEIVQVHVSEWV